MRLFSKRLKQDGRYNRLFVCDAWWSRGGLWCILPSIGVEFCKNWLVGFHWLKFTLRIGVEEYYDARDVMETPI